MKRVVVVEDDPTIAEVIKIALERLGHIVMSFSNGQLIFNNDFIHPDIFIIDMQLSGFDGLDLCRFLKSQYSTKKIPIIMMSAHPEIKRFSKEVEADGVLEKPFHLEELRRLVEQLLQD